mmetsp:Transcript_10147/g.9096  ORF Transcript_10147/g.9096 Transcript_10147/m.9096 type:complete len:102 (-) Transcript_10147:39-344(-)
MTRPGGYRDVAVADEEIQQFIIGLKSSIALKLNESESLLNDFKAISYTSRAVLGGNYIVKIQLNDGRVIHIKANKFPNRPSELIAIQVEGITLESPLETIN